MKHRRALTHPATLACVLLLVLNDHVLKERFPGVVTGKLSDLAGMWTAPLFLLGVFDLLATRRLAAAPRYRFAPWVALGVVAVLFAAAKTWAPATHAYELTAGICRAPFRWCVSLITGRPVWSETIHLVRDPSDLLALPMGIAAAWLAVRTADDPRGENWRPEAAVLSTRG
jgi:hypothetical protein